MSARTVRRRRLATGFGLAGGLIGVAAGVTQAAVGDQIPQWSGSKQAPVALGLLTVALSLVAVGTVPFAAVAWTSIVPLLVTVEAFAVALHVDRRRAE